MAVSWTGLLQLGEVLGSVATKEKYSVGFRGLDLILKFSSVLSIYCLVYEDTITGKSRRGRE